MPACGWEVLGCENCTAYTSLSPEVQAEVDAWAVNRLWEWTNQRFGPCEITVHSDEERCCALRAIYDCRRNEAAVPGPVHELLEVVVNGEVVPLEQLHVDNYTLIVWDSGQFTGEWSATYTIGEPVPPGGSLVAGILACEYAKSLCNDTSCRLPKRVSSVQRQGVVIGILDNFSNVAEGFTGIFEIDDWIMAATKPNRRAAISSPDVEVPRITTWSYSDS